MTDRQKAEKYIQMALDMGATDAVYFEADQICWDSRTLLKCMYGCTDWGKNHTCPSRPGNPTMAEMKEMFSRYSWGIIIHTGTVLFMMRWSDWPRIFLYDIH